MNETIKKILTFGGGIAFLAILVLYSLYQGHDALFGSQFNLAPISQNNGDVVTLSGTALHSKQITINGEPTSLDSNGTFSEPVALLPGYNVITVASVDAFGKTKTRTVYAYRSDTIQTAVNIPPAPETPQSKTSIN